MDWPTFLSRLEPYGFRDDSQGFTTVRDSDGVRMSWVWCSVCNNAHVHAHGSPWFKAGEWTWPEAVLDVLAKEAEQCATKRSA